jgi:hypothetical protein
VGHGPSSGICGTYILIKSWWLSVSSHNTEAHDSPFSSSLEDDVKDGTSRIKRALLEVVYELDKACVEGGTSLFRKRSSTLRDKTMMDQQQQPLPPQSQPQQPLGVLVSSLVDPDEDPLL